MSAQSLSSSFHKSTEDTVPYFSFLSLSLPFHTFSLSGYVTVVDFIHFFQMKKKLLPALGSISWQWPPLFWSSQEIGERWREWERKRWRERWRLSSKVGPVTVWPCGPQSEGWREEKEGRSVTDEGQQQKPPRRVEEKLRGKLSERRGFRVTHLDLQSKHLQQINQRKHTHTHNMYDLSLVVRWQNVFVSDQCDMLITQTVYTSLDPQCKCFPTWGSRPSKGSQEKSERSQDD